MSAAAIKPVDFDRLIDRTDTACAKWDRYKGRDVIPLWVADMDFMSPQPVIEALKQRAIHGVFGYTRPPETLTATVLDVLASRYGWSVQAQWLVWLPGVVSGLNAVCRAVGEDGDAVMTAVPIYPPFLSAPTNSRRRLIEVPLMKNKTGWRLDIDRFAEAITPQTRLFMLCNPHNPVGRLFSREELMQITRICIERDIKICSDEIHCDLILDANKTHLPTAALDEEVARRTVTLMAPSKTFNIPGLGCAFAVISDPALRRRFKAVMDGIVPHVNAMGFSAALAAYRGGWTWLDALINYLRQNRQRVSRAVAAMPGVSMTPVEATYLAWIDIRDTGIDDPVGFFENAGVGLSDGKEFGAPGFVRLNFGCPQFLLQKALQRMHAALVRYYEA